MWAQPVATSNWSELTEVRPARALGTRSAAVYVPCLISLIPSLISLIHRSWVRARPSRCKRLHPLRRTFLWGSSRWLGSCRGIINSGKARRRAYSSPSSWWQPPSWWCRCSPTWLAMVSKIISTFSPGRLPKPLHRRMQRWLWAWRDRYLRTRSFWVSTWFFHRTIHLRQSSKLSIVMA